MYLLNTHIYKLYTYIYKRGHTCILWHTIERNREDISLEKKNGEIDCTR